MHKLMAKAITQLLVRLPFFATLALQLELVESEKTQTMATDGKALYYNPTWVATLALIEVISVIAHEVLHVAFCHHLRRNGRDADLWNRACDYAINGILVKFKIFRLPDGGLYDPKYDGKSAETIYNILAGEQAKQQQQDKADDAQSDEASDDSSEGAGDSGEGEDADAPAPSQPLVGEVWDATGEDGEPLSVSEKAAEQLKANANIAAALDAEKQLGFGEVDAALKEAIEVNKIREVAWYEQLIPWVSELIETRSSFNTPDRRLLHTGHILPGAISEPDFHMVFGWDTSGSLTEELTGRITTHLNNIIHTLNPSSVTIIYCDTKVRGEPDRFELDAGATSWDTDIEIKPRGGGGTEFDPLFDYIKDKDIDPDFLIYFTDGHGHVGVEEPDYPIVWATTDKLPTFHKSPFGDLVELE
jgi:predicted metal-dependent peptidase